MGQDCPGGPGSLCCRAGLGGFLSSGATPENSPRSLCVTPSLPRGQQSSTVSVEQVLSPRGCQRPWMGADKLLQVLAEVSPRWRPRQVPGIRGILFLSLLAAVLCSTPTPAPPSGWALTSSSRYPKRQWCLWRPALHPVPSLARVTSRDCSALQGQGLALGTRNGRASRASQPLVFHSAAKHVWGDG